MPCPPTLTPTSTRSKSLGWTAKYEDAIEHLLKGSARTVDVGHVQMGEGTAQSVGRHFINISSCGSSAVIAQIANSSPNIFGSTITFYQASVRGLLQYQPRDLCIKVFIFFKWCRHCRTWCAGGGVLKCRT